MSCSATLVAVVWDEFVTVIWYVSVPPGETCVWLSVFVRVSVGLTHCTVVVTRELVLFDVIGSFVEDVVRASFWIVLLHACVGGTWTAMLTVLIWFTPSVPTEQVTVVPLTRHVLSEKNWLYWSPVSSWSMISTFCAGLVPWFFTETL